MWTRARAPRASDVRACVRGFRLTIDGETDERTNGTRRNATGVRGVRDDDSKGRTDGRAARRVLCLCCANILSLSRACVCARARVSWR